MKIVTVKNALLEAIGEKPLTIVPNCGNAGDSLINHAIFSLAKKNNIKFNYEDPRNLSPIRPDNCYLLMVNGGLRADKHHVFDDIIKTLNGKAPIVLFSATISNRDDLIKSLHKSTIIVCREPVTYQYIEHLRPDLKIILSEDATMAIPDGDALLPEASGLSYLLHKVRCKVKTIVRKAPYRFLINPTDYTIQNHNNERYMPAFRVDDEKTDIELPKGNVDLSLLLSTRRTDPEGCNIASAYLLKILKAAPIVKTNRLHITIGCCLVSTECHVYANNYFKVKSIYEHSLLKRYNDKVIWKD